MKRMELRLTDVYFNNGFKDIGVFEITQSSVPEEDKVLVDYILSKEEREYLVGIPLGTGITFETTPNYEFRMVI